MASGISPPEEGSTVVSWSPPFPPNGVILYYNVRITRADNGELLVFIKELNDTKIDIANYDYIPGMEYKVMVWLSFTEHVTNILRRGLAYLVPPVFKLASFR